MTMIQEFMCDKCDTLFEIKKLLCKKCENTEIYVMVKELCIEIFAHNQLDCEVTLCGNGTNSAEASNVAMEILEILGIEYKDLADDIEKMVTLYKEEYYM